MRSVESLNILLSHTESAMLRKPRSLTRDTKAVGEVIGVILMVTLSLVVAVTVHVYLGDPTVNNKAVLPMISMMEGDNSVKIVDIQFGPVETKDLVFKIFDEDGIYACEGILNSAEDELNAGDTISPSLVLTIGEAYDVLAIYNENLVGEARFTYT